ncbi:MAG: hypothetical protein ACQEUN_16970 [Pseudomonadota bacterium]
MDTPLGMLPCRDQKTFVFFTECFSLAVMPRADGEFYRGVQLRGRAMRGKI